MNIRELLIGSNVPDSKNRALLHTGLGITFMGLSMLPKSPELTSSLTSSAWLIFLGAIPQLGFGVARVGREMKQVVGDGFEDARVHAEQIFSLERDIDVLDEQYGELLLNNIDSETKEVVEKLLSSYGEIQAQLDADDHGLSEEEVRKAEDEMIGLIKQADSLMMSNLEANGDWATLIQVLGNREYKTNLQLNLADLRK